MGALAKIALKVGWTVVKKSYNKIMQLLGQGWTIDQITKWLSRH